MLIPIKPLFLLVLVLLFTSFAKAQPGLYYFSPISNTCYSKEISRYKERTIPIIYTDKESQKKYAEIIKERNESIVEEFEKDRVVADTLLLNKCNSILQKIKAGNSNFNFNNISLYINRSCVANASCYGEGTLFVNLGLFLWADNDDELALIVAHELSHQLMNHSDSRTKNYIATIMSDDFKNEIKAIKKSDDGKYERYKKLMKDLVTENGVHSRYKESEADSLGLALIKNAGYNVTNAATILLKLDHVDDLFVAKNLYTAKTAFKNAGADSFIIERRMKYNGLSMATVTMNADKDFDSVKTHPDCIARFKKLTASATEPPISCCININNSFKEIKERALIEIIRYTYEANHLTLCAHFCLFAMQNGYTNTFYSNFLSLCFSGIYAADKKLEKFSVTNTRAKAGSTLKELQDFIFNTNSGNIISIAGRFLNADNNKTSEDYFFAELMYYARLNPQEAGSRQQKFLSRFSNSKYKYLLNSEQSNKQ